MQDVYTQLSAALTATASLGAAAVTVSLQRVGDTVHVCGTLDAGEQVLTQTLQAPFPPPHRDAPPLDPARLERLLAKAASEAQRQGDWPRILEETLFLISAQLPALLAPLVMPDGLVGWLVAPEHPWLSGTLASNMRPEGRLEAHGVRVAVVHEGIRLTAQVLLWDADGHIEQIAEQEVWAGPLSMQRWNDPVPDVSAAAGLIASWKLLLCGRLAGHQEEWMIFPNDLFEMWPWALLGDAWATFTPREPRRSPVKRAGDRAVQIGAWTLALRDDVLLLHKQEEAGLPVLWRDGERVHCLDGDERSAEALLAWLSRHASPRCAELSETLASWRWMLAPLPSWEAGAQQLAAAGLLARLGAWRRWGQFLRTRQPGFRSWLEAPR